MARFKTEIQLNQPQSFIDFIIKDYFNKETFTCKEKKGEVVWQYGTGFLTAPQFIKYKYENGLLTIEAWLKFPILPGVFLGEMGLTGFYGAIPKSNLRKKVDQLVQLASQPLPSNMPIEDFSNNLNYNENGTLNGQSINVYGHDTSSKASLSLIFAILSIIIVIFSSLIGLIFGILGINSAKKALHSSKKGLATAGLVISIIGTVLGALSFILNLMFAAEII